MTKSNKLVGTPPGVINTNNHPNQLRPRENAAVYGPLAIMWNYVQEMRDISSGNMLLKKPIIPDLSIIKNIRHTGLIVKFKIIFIIFTFVKSRFVYIPKNINNNNNSNI